MTKKKKPFSFKANKTNPFVPGGVTPKETEELAKSIARDIQIPDRPLSMQELSEINPLTGQPRKKDKDEHATHIDFSTPDPLEVEAYLLEKERNMIDRIDAEMDT